LGIKYEKNYLKLYYSTYETNKISNLILLVTLKDLIPKDFGCEDALNEKSLCNIITSTKGN